MAAKKTGAATKRNAPDIDGSAVPVTETPEAAVADTAETAVFDTPNPSGEEPKEAVLDILGDIREIAQGSTPKGGGELELKAVASKIDPGHKIPVKSLFHGKLVYTSPTNGAKWIWKDYGTVVWVPFGELQTMNNQKPRFLNAPMLVILEPDVVAEFNFGDMYRKVASLTKLSKMLEGGKVEEVRKAVRELLDVGMRESVLAEVRRCRMEDTLTNINVINMLNKELNTDIT